MATKEMRVCDAYGTTKRVETYVVSVKRILATAEDDQLVKEGTGDFSPRGLARLLRFIDRGMSPPGPAKVMVDTEAPPNA